MLHGLFSPKGRLNRAPFFWYSVLVNITFSVLILPLVIGPMFSLMRSLKGQSGTTTINLGVVQTFALLRHYPANLVGLIVLFAAFQFMFVMFMIKRLHDLDQSGWWALPLWIAGCLSSLDYPVLSTMGGLVALGGGIYLLFFRGTAGENRFGPNPLQ